MYDHHVGKKVTRISGTTITFEDGASISPGGNLTNELVGEILLGVWWSDDRQSRILKFGHPVEGSDPVINAKVVAPVEEVPVFETPAEPEHAVPEEGIEL